MRPARRMASSMESRGPGLPGIVGTPDSLNGRLRNRLVAHAPIASGDGPIHFRPTFLEDLGEVRVLGEEAVARVHGVGARDLGRRDERRDVQV